METLAKVRFSSGSVLKWLILCIVSIVTMNGIAQYLRFFQNQNDLMGFYRLLNINGEANLPAWFSAMQLLLAALLCAVAAQLPRHREAGYSRHWLVLGATMAFLSLDEAAYLHEHLKLHILDRLDVPSPLDHWWKIYLFLGACLGIYLLRFLLVHLSPRTRKLFFLSGITFVTGAILVEKFGSGYTIQHWGEESFQFMMSQTVEETLEMLGISLFVYAVLRELSDAPQPVIEMQVQQ